MRTRPDEDPAGRDAEIAALLRARYAPPADEGYWAGLETRILSRIRSGAADASAWWNVVWEWAPIGVAAAAAAALFAGIAVTQTRAAQARVAYESMVRNAAPLPVQTVTLPTGVSAEEATFRYVIAY